LNAEIRLTEDGSTTFFSNQFKQHYHSQHGAIQESMHIFINAGFRQLCHRDSLKVFEMGFGTGLNVLLTLIMAEQLRITVQYETVELFPLQPEEALKANFPSLLGGWQNEFVAMHQGTWNKTIALSNRFFIRKQKVDLTTVILPGDIDLVYFDAFDPETQPQLWTSSIFQKIYNAMSNGAILVTYSSKGTVKRALREAGFKVERLPGPPGKRHMVKATKFNSVQ
jgi:Uncharacterized conserved protein